MPVTQMTLNDGTTTVVVADRATLSTLQQRFAPLGGSAVLRFADGGAEKHSNWQKRRITITASGWQPPQLETLDYSQPITLTLHDWANGTQTFTVFTDGPTQTDNLRQSTCSWSLVADEV